MLSENKADFLVFESRDCLGGVWCFSEDKSTTTVMEFTETSSSKAWTEASDYPIDEEFGEFPTQYNILKYLSDFATHFDLNKLIRYNHLVTHIKKEKDPSSRRRGNRIGYCSSLKTLL